MVYQTPHPVHADWAEAGHLEMHPWLRRSDPYPAIPLRDLDAALAIPRCDVALAEGGGPAGACVLAKRIGRVKKAILLAADETWSRLNRRLPTPLPLGERLWWRAFGGGLDGAIAVSPYVAADLSALFPRLPVRVVRPHVLPRLRESLEKSTPTLDGARILHMSHRSEKNGTRLLIEAFGEVRRRVPGAELHLIGESGPLGGSKLGTGVVAHGRVPEVASHLRGASLFCLPGLGQACPVSSLEAMVAGVPALVSDETGTKDIAASVDPGLVTPAEPEAVASAILAYFARPVGERRELGLCARRATADLTPEAQGAAFTSAFASLVGAPA